MSARDLIIPLAARLMREAAAPYHEQGVRRDVEAICWEHGLELQRDRHGNVLVFLNTTRALRPLVLAAHMDHPGFEIQKQIAERKWFAKFRGGVGPAYFKRGVRVRLLPGGSRAKLVKPGSEEKTFELETGKPPALPPEFAVWELEDFSLKRDRIVARACDDLIGVAVALATIIQLKKARARVNVIAALTRAEEVGFQGALALAAEKKLPKGAFIVSLETSRELPCVKMGSGVILRVGDKMSTFDSAGMRFLAEVAADLQAGHKQFQYQRALMSGGTCEASAYQEFGYQCAAMCVALGNYHNCGPANRIAAEYVSVRDALSMLDLLVETARRMRDYAPLTARFPLRLRKLLREAHRCLASDKINGNARALNPKRKSHVPPRRVR